MNRDAVGAMGEVFGAAAVILSLAAQIRQNTRSVRAASLNAITDSFNHVADATLERTRQQYDLWVAVRARDSGRWWARAAGYTLVLGFIQSGSRWESSADTSRSSSLF